MTRRLVSDADVQDTINAIVGGNGLPRWARLDLEALIDTREELIAVLEKIAMANYVNELLLAKSNARAILAQVRSGEASDV
jgi:hypothetical protein